MKRLWKFVSASLISSILSSFAVHGAEIIKPSASDDERRILWFQDFEDGKTSMWQCSEGSPNLIEHDGSTVYEVQKYDYIDFENVNKLVNFRMEFNMKYRIPEESRGKAWPALYIKSLNPTQRYEIFFETSKDAEGINLRRSGKNTLYIPYSFYNLNEQWFYVRIDVKDNNLLLYINDTKTPVMTFEDQAPLISGPLGFVRGNSEYFYIDNLLITADPLAPGGDDPAFTDIAPVPPKSENIYGETYLDKDFSDGFIEPFKDISTKTEISDGRAKVTGRLAAGDSSWRNYSVEMDISLKDKQILNSTQPFFKFRCTDEYNYYMLRTNAAGSVIQIYKCVNGTPVWIAQTVFYLNSERTLSLRLDIHSDKISFYSRSTSYPDFEYPLLTFSDASLTRGGIEFCKPDYLSSIDVKKVKVREIASLGNIGPRPDPVPLATVTENPFYNWRDIENHWASENLKFLGSNGIISGYPDNTFRPGEPVSVKEALKMICIAFDAETVADSDDWAAPYIAAALKNEWFSPNTFDSYDRHITRGELASVLMAASSGKTDISEIIQGDDNGSTELSRDVTRAEAAVMISRCMSEVFIPSENTELTAFHEYEKAFANPYKGFRNIVGDPYVTLVQCTLYWNQIENSENDGVEKIIEEANKLFEGFPENNTKAIIGVMLEFPPYKYWPSDMTEGDYSSPQFISRMEKLIEKLGAAFDNDPRVAFIQMKIIGKWGEMQDPSPTPEVAHAMSEAYHKYFKNKLVQTNIVPHMGMYKEYKFGTHWDSYGHWNNLSLLDFFESDYMKDLWKECPVNGETAFDWGETLGRNPNDAVINHQARYIDIIRGTHCTCLGWLSRYDKKDPDTTKAAIDIQKSMGYRFVLQNARYKKRIDKGEKLGITFTVANTGSAPIYYNEPVELALLNPQTREVVWKCHFSDTDIRKWLPDDDYSKTPVYTVSEEFMLPDNIPAGIYTLALSINDSEGGNVPAVRFANTNYYKGGRTPIGNISVASDEVIPMLSEADFDDLFTDKLHYVYDSSNDAYLKQ